MKGNYQNIGKLYRKHLKNNRKNESGITLVALIVTIIVLIILTVVTISSISDNKILKSAIDGTESQTIEMAKEKLSFKIAELKAEFGKNFKKLELADLIILNKEENTDIFVETTNIDENGQEIEEKVIIYSEDGEKDYAKVLVGGCLFKVTSDFDIIYIDGKIAVKPGGTNPKEDDEKDDNYEGIEDDDELKQDDIVLDSDLNWDKNADEIFITTVPNGWTGIYTQNDLDAIKNNLNGKYILMNDIVLSGNWTPIGSATEEFSGYFNGNGYSISNMKVSVASGYAGMFARTSGGASITNLTLKNYTITASGNYIGSLVRI